MPAPNAWKRYSPRTYLPSGRDPSGSSHLHGEEIAPRLAHCAALIGVIDVATEAALTPWVYS